MPPLNLVARGCRAAALPLFPFFAPNPACFQQNRVQAPGSPHCCSHGVPPAPAAPPESGGAGEGGGGGLPAA